MSVNPWEDEPALAREIVRKGLSALDASGIVKERIEDLSLLSVKEHFDLKEFGDRIDAYRKLANPDHPLCLGVFGPPGSGKSFAVKQLIKYLGLSSRTLNLSQFQGPNDLSAALAELARWTTGAVPVVFFDEFDSRLNGAPLGWLQWLLAPMQDGVAFDHGHRVELKRAVFVFAGGTADSFEEFPGVHEEHYRAAKGPDFVSRLRGHLNIRGVNDGPYRRVRRAIVLRLRIERVVPALLDEKCRIPEDRMSDAFIDQLLAVGRYRHGSRSVEALVEMSTTPDQQSFSGGDLPARDVLSNHVDLGPLGEVVIALSAGGERQVDNPPGSTPQLAQIWPVVATRLLEMGAGLIYGGDLKQGDGVFTQELIRADARLPNLLLPVKSAEEQPLSRPGAGRVTWVQAGTGSRQSSFQSHDRVAQRQLENLSPAELKEFGLPPETDLNSFNRNAPIPDDWRNSEDWKKRLGFALAIFRMRALITRLADAHLVFGGRERGSLGRFPGIAEEVMLSLASGRPVYICGGFGGAAHAVGQALGLGVAWAVTPLCLQRDAHEPGATKFEAATAEFRDWFQLPERSDLPMSHSDLLEFLRLHALEGPKWPDNGLTADDNRTLFRSTDEHEIVDLVEKGLRRRFGLK